MNNYAHNKSDYDAWVGNVDFFDVAISGAISGLTYGQSTLMQVGIVLAGSALQAGIDINGNGKTSRNVFDGSKDLGEAGTDLWLNIICNAMTVKFLNYESTLYKAAQKAGESVATDLAVAGVANFVTNFIPNFGCNLAKDDFYHPKLTPEPKISNEYPLPGSQYLNPNSNKKILHLPNKSKNNYQNTNAKEIQNSLIALKLSKI